MKSLDIFISFIAIMIIAFFAIGFVDSIATPSSGAGLNQYNNLSQATDIAGTGINAVMLMLVLAMVIAAVVFLISFVRKK